MMMTDCPFVINGGCAVVSELCGGEFVQTDDNACRACDTLAKPGPRQLNDVTATLAIRYLLAKNPGTPPTAYPELLPYLRKSGPPSPGALEKAARLAAATAKWIAAGWPVRSNEEVQRLYNDVCQPCPHFQRKDEKTRCALCGCRLNTTRGMNKLLWATESCPANPPRFLSDY